MNRTQGAGASVPKTEGGGFGERITMTTEIITQCHGLMSLMDEKFSGPSPEESKVCGTRPSAGLLSDVCELQDTATNLRNRLNDLVKML